MAKLITDTTEAFECELLKESMGESKIPTYIIKGIYAQADVRNGNNRIYPYEDLKREIERFDKEMIKTGRALGNLEHPNCFSNPNFKVLTETGWKKFVDLKVGDMVWTRNSDKTSVLQPIKRIVNETYNGNTYTIHGRNIDGEYTEEHRVLVEDRYGNVSYHSIKEIYENRKHFSHHSIPKTMNVTGSNAKKTKTFNGVKRIKDNPNFKYESSEDIELDTNTFCKLLGIWLSEGSVHGKTNSDGTFRPLSISVVQSLRKNSDKCEQIDGLWELLSQKFVTSQKILGNGNKMWTLSDMRVATFFNSLGNVYSKHVPEEVFSYSKNDLETLLIWFSMGDGRRSRHNKTYDNVLIDNIMDMFSVSEQLISDLSYISILCGVGSSIDCVVSKKDYIFANHLIRHENKKPLFFANVLANTKVILTDKKNLKIEKHENVDAGAYCITVENGNFFVNYNGKCYWTGNCAEIKPADAAVRILEMKEDNKSWIGKSVILASDKEHGIKGTPQGDILLGIVQYGTKVGFSTRSLGTVNESTGEVSDLHLCTIDCVTNPSIGCFCSSNADRFVNGILESKTFIINTHGEILEEKYNNLEKQLSKTPNTYISSNKSEYLGGIITDFFNSINGK